MLLSRALLCRERAVWKGRQFTHFPSIGDHESALRVGLVALQRLGSFRRCGANKVTNKRANREAVANFWFSNLFSVCEANSEPIDLVTDEANVRSNCQTFIRPPAAICSGWVLKLC